MASYISLISSGVKFGHTTEHGFYKLNIFLEGFGMSLRLLIREATQVSIPDDFILER